MTAPILQRPQVFMRNLKEMVAKAKQKEAEVKEAAKQQAEELKKQQECDAQREQLGSKSKSTWLRRLSIFVHRGKKGYRNLPIWKRALIWISLPIASVLLYFAIQLIVASALAISILTMLGSFLAKVVFFLPKIVKTAFVVLKCCTRTYTGTKETLQRHKQISSCDDFKGIQQTGGVKAEKGAYFKNTILRSKSGQQVVLKHSTLNYGLDGFRIMNLYTLVIVPWHAAVYTLSWLLGLAILFSVAFGLPVVSAAVLNGALLSSYTALSPTLAMFTSCGIVMAFLSLVLWCFKVNPLAWFWHNLKLVFHNPEKPMKGNYFKWDFIIFMIGNFKTAYVRMDKPENVGATFLPKQPNWFMRVYRELNPKMEKATDPSMPQNIKQELSMGEKMSDVALTAITAPGVAAALAMGDVATALLLLDQTGMMIGAGGNTTRCGSKIYIVEDDHHFVCMPADMKLTDVFETPEGIVVCAEGTYGRPKFGWPWKTFYKNEPETYKWQVLIKKSTT